MVSVNTIPVQEGFQFFDSMSSAGANPELPALAPPSMEDQSKKIRKPYTITKSRESWSDQEHDKFLEALQLFDRDWKKIEAFVGSKTVIQIRSHAQKYFLKVQKSGASEHVPPPRPKRKASHPYPHKAPKNVPHVTHVSGPFQSSAERGYLCRPDSLSIFGNPVTGPTLPSWSFSSVPPVNVPRVTTEDESFMPNSSSHSSSIESTPKISQTTETIDPKSRSNDKRDAPDFAQVYHFIGSVFDPNASGHLQKLKQMESINLETALLLMRNLTVNLTSPKFEDHIKLISSYDADLERGKSGGACEFPYKSEILST